MTDSAILDALLAREGSEYTDRPNDRGGPTKYGITLATLSAWRGHPVTPEDVRDLTEGEARAIYRERYIDGPRFREIRDPLLREWVIDMGVNHGTTRASEWLQEAIGGVTVDGRVGAFTLGALAQRDPVAVLLRMVARRVEFYGEILSRNYRDRRAGRTTRDESENALGWLRRGVAPLRELAAGMDERPMEVRTA